MSPQVTAPLSSVLPSFSPLPPPPTSTPFPYTTLFRSFRRTQRGATPSALGTGRRRGSSPGQCATARHRQSPSHRTTRSEEHTSELQSRPHLVCRLLLEKKNKSFSPGGQNLPPASLLCG